MPSREPSPAEESLVAEVNKRLGSSVTTKQFERWRSEKYLRPLNRHWRGRKGSASSWDRGEYFLVPSLKALERLADGATASTAIASGTSGTTSDESTDRA